jgi:drug/metabolite transporter (DMT)-like permease
MFPLLTILTKIVEPYFSMFRKELAKDDIAPLTITHSPNLIGHPLGIILLLSLGMFILPTDFHFFLYWFGMIVISGVVSTFAILGLLETKFFTAQVIGSLGFVSSAICAHFFLKEPLGVWTIISLCIAVIGVLFFSCNKDGKKALVFDRGTIFIIIAVALGGFSSVLYKLATTHVTGPAMLFTGRFVGDLIGWTIVWLISLCIIKKNPISDLGSLLKKSHGRMYVIGVIITTGIDALLFYHLPVTSLSILGTITFPVMYLISYFKYKERITPLMWFGTFCIISSIILFLLFR